jgi:hypothetical protein
MQTIRLIPALAGWVTTLVLGLAVPVAESRSTEGPPLVQVAPGQQVELPLDVRAHGAVVAVRVLPADRRVPAQPSLSATVTRNAVGNAVLRVTAGRDAVPGGPYLMEGRSRDRRMAMLPFRIQVVAGNRAAAPAPSRVDEAPSRVEQTPTRVGQTPSRVEQTPTRIESAVSTDRRIEAPVARQRQPAGELSTAGPPAAATGIAAGPEVISSAVSPPAGRALVILLENDGLRSSLEAIGTELPNLPAIPFLAYPKGAEAEDQVQFLLLKNESIPQALSRLSSDIAASVTPGTDVFSQAHHTACGLLPTSATRVLTENCSPRQDCFDLSSNNPACHLLPASAQCPSTEFYNPRQECLNNPPSGPMLHTAMMHPGNWEVRWRPFEEWLDVWSDFIIEEIAKVAKHQSAFSGRYHQVVVLEDHQVKPDIAVNAIRSLSQNHVVDIHVLTHGSTNRIVGVREGNTTHDLTEATFFAPLRAAKQAGEPVWIRSVYQMNCNSGTLIDEWQSVGASVVGGTLHGDVSNYLPQQYIPFVNHWLGNAPFRNAADLAYQQARFVSEEFYAVISQEA